MIQIDVNLKILYQKNFVSVMVTRNLSKFWIASMEPSLRKKKKKKKI